MKLGRVDVQNLVCSTTRTAAILSNYSCKAKEGKTRKNRNNDKKNLYICCAHKIIPTVQFNLQIMVFFQFHNYKFLQLKLKNRLNLKNK